MLRLGILGIAHLQLNLDTTRVSEQLCISRLNTANRHLLKRPGGRRSIGTPQSVRPTSYSPMFISLSMAHDTVVLPAQSSRIRITASMHALELSYADIRLLGYPSAYPVASPSWLISHTCPGKSLHQSSLSSRTLRPDPGLARQRLLSGPPH